MRGRRRPDRSRLSCGGRAARRRAARPRRREVSPTTGVHAGEADAVRGIGGDALVAHGEIEDRGEHAVDLSDRRAGLARGGEFLARLGSPRARPRRAKRQPTGRTWTESAFSYRARVVGLRLSLLASHCSAITPTVVFERLGSTYPPVPTAVVTSPTIAARRCGEQTVASAAVRPGRSSGHAIEAHSVTLVR